MRIIRALQAAAMTLAIGALTAGTASAQVEMKIGHGHTPSHSFHSALERFKEILEEKAPGEFEVSIFPSAQLGDERVMQEALTLGTLEATVTGVLSIYEPKLSLLELPYLFRDREHILKAQHSDAVAELTSSLPPAGLRLIAFFENGFRNITTNRGAIEGPEDVGGMAIRTPENMAQIETFRALGANPTPMPFSELYAALRQGVVDGQENPLQNIYDGKLFEVQDHLALTGHIYNSAYMVVSEDWFQGLSEAQHQAIVEAADEAALWQFNLIAELDDELRQKLAEEGMQITEPDREAFRAATAPAYDAFYEEFGEDARRFVEAIEAL